MGFPVWTQIAGAIAGVFPFVLRKGEARAVWENGVLVSWHYRDWFAILGGGACLALAIFGAASLRRAPKRMPYAAIAVVLVALGAYQLARGFGVVGVSKPAGSARVAVTEAPRKRVADAAVATPPSAALQAAVTKIFEQWRDGKVEQLYAEANPELREAISLPALARFLDEEDDRLGVFERVVTMELGEPDGGHQVVMGDAKFAHGVASYSMYFAGTGPAPVLHHLNIQLPEALGAPPPVEDAAKTARRALDAILAGDVPAFTLLLAADDELTPEDEVGLATFRGRLGATKSVEQTRDEDCEVVRRCVEFRVVGAKSRGDVRFDLDVNLTRWQLYGFEFELDKAK